MSQASLTPRLVVRDADAALAFYRKAFRAELGPRYTDDKGHVVHAELVIEGSALSLTEEQRAWMNDAPTTIGGSPVILSLTVDDVDAVGKSVVAAGGEIVFPIATQEHGRREGRFRDPFGHLWILTKALEGPKGA